MSAPVEITLVRARLADVPCDPAVLSAEERTRAAGLAGARARTFIAGRGLVRRTLARTLGVAPTELVIVEPPDGKPHLPLRTVDFSLSHGGAWLLLALARGGQVGVDVEPLAPARDADAIAAALGLTLSPTVTFAQQWARLEALCKATGRGLTVPIDPDVGAGLTVRDLDLAPDHAAAIAWTGTVAHITELSA